MVEWWSILLWKGELISYEIGYLAEEVSKQSAEGAARLSLLLIVKREGRGELWEKMLSMKEPDLKIWKNYQPIYIVKNESIFWRAHQGCD